MLGAQGTRRKGDAIFEAAIAVIKLKIFIGGNMSPRSQPAWPAEGGYTADTFFRFRNCQ